MSFFSVDVSNDFSTIFLFTDRLVQAHGKSIIEHATCQIAFCDDSQLKDLLPKREEQLACMEKVAKDVEAGKAFRLPTSLSYKMIAGLANFHKEYRTTGEISLNGDTLESMARASFSSVKEGGTFSVSASKRFMISRVSRGLLMTLASWLATRTHCQNLRFQC